MAISRLELVSAHGDQSLSQVRFVLYGAGQQAINEAMRQGLSFVEGRAVVSTNLMHAYAQATGPANSYHPEVTSGETGAIMVIAMPRDFHVGYATFTTAYVDRAMKMVLGAPLRFASGRKQLAFYMDEDVEAVRKRIESEAMGGFPVANHPTFRVEPRYVIGTFRPSPSLKAVITQLEVSAKAFEAIDFDAMESALSSLFAVREAAEAVLVPTMARDVVVGTVESVILTHIRLLRWQGLALLGYRFREGREDVVVAPPSDVAEQRRKIDECGRLIASSGIFNGELAWLKVYVANQLGLMKVELDGAELEAA